MKIRRGFVTNSSSSSFVVGFARKPESVNDLRTMLFGDADEHGIYDRNFPTQTLAQCVWDDMQNQEPNIYSDLLTEFMDGSYELDGADDGMECFDLESPEERMACFNRIAQHNDELAVRAFSKFMDEHAPLFFYIFGFSDDTPLGSVLEHSGIFDKLTHVRFSHH